MSSLSVALLPLEDRCDEYSILRAFPRSKTLVAIQKNAGRNVISVCQLVSHILYIRLSDHFSMGRQFLPHLRIRSCI